EGDEAGAVVEVDGEGRAGVSSAADDGCVVVVIAAGSATVPASPGIVAKATIPASRPAPMVARPRRPRRRNSWITPYTTGTNPAIHSPNVGQPAATPITMPSRSSMPATAAATTMPIMPST